MNKLFIEVKKILEDCNFHTEPFTFKDENGSSCESDQIKIGDRIIKPVKYYNIWFKKTGTYHEGNDEKYIAIKANVVVDELTGYVFEKNIELLNCSIIDGYDLDTFNILAYEALNLFKYLDNFNEDNNLSIFDGTTKTIC